MPPPGAQPGAAPGARLLVVDDDSLQADTLGMRLRHEGFEVVCVYEGRKALDLALREPFNVVILDLIMPDMNGWQVCEQLKKLHYESPILMLSASGEEQDRVTGLEMGADDYVVKPYSFRELVARVRVLLRRHGPARRTVGPFEIDFERRVILKNRQDVALSPKEFAIVALLLRRTPRVVKRGEILQEVWGPDFIGDEKTVAIHMRWIRQKLEDVPDRPVFLRTARGGGYYFTVTSHEPSPHTV